MSTPVKTIFCIGESTALGAGDREHIGWPGRIAGEFQDLNPPEERGATPLFYNLSILGETACNMAERVAQANLRLAW